MNVADSHAEKLLATAAAARRSVRQGAAEATSTMGLKRETFTTSRLLDFFSEKELIAQVGHPVRDWPLTVIKELIDNSLDACEEAGGRAGHPRRRHGQRHHGH